MLKTFFLVLLCFGQNASADFGLNFQAVFGDAFQVRQPSGTAILPSQRLQTTEDLLQRYLEQDSQLGVEERQLRQEEGFLYLNRRMKDSELQAYEELQNRENQLSTREFNLYISLSEKIKFYEDIMKAVGKFASSFYQAKSVQSNHRIPGVIKLSDSDSDNDGADKQAEKAPGGMSALDAAAAASSSSETSKEEVMFLVHLKDGVKICLGGHQRGLANDESAGSFWGPRWKLNEALMKKYGIGGMFAVAEQLKQFEEDFKGTAGRDVQIHDLKDEPAQKIDFQFMVKNLNEMIERMKNKNENKNIVVFCLEGRSRSPAVLIAWLIQYEGLSYEEAIEKLQDARKNREKNNPPMVLSTFMPQLLVYEESLRKEEKEEKEKIYERLLTKMNDIIKTHEKGDEKDSCNNDIWGKIGSNGFLILEEATRVRKKQMEKQLKDLLGLKTEEEAAASAE